MHGKELRIEELNEDQRKLRDIATFEAWGRSLSLEQYLDREIALRSVPWSARISKTWLLRDSDQKSLASCETYPMRSRIGAEEGVSIGIASVYVEPVHRGRRYSAYLLNHLIEEAFTRSRERGASPLHSYFLFSEVGTRIYEEAGFKAVPSQALHLLPSKVLWPSRLKADLISEKETEKLPIFSHSQALNLSDCLQILPDFDQWEWHWRRQNLYAEFLNKKVPAYVGARCGGSWILWMANYQEFSLDVLSYDAKEGGELKALFLAALFTARELDLKRVEVWLRNEQPDLRIILRDLDPIGVDRDESIAMIRPLPVRLNWVHWRGVDRSIWV